MPFEFKILTSAYLEEYSKQADIDWRKVSSLLRKKAVFSSEDFLFYLQASSTYSSNIEGNTLDVDTFLRNKQFKIRSKPKEMQEIEDLINAYNYAVGHVLNQQNFLEAHRLLSRAILSVKKQRGALRKQPIGIYGGGKLEYLAVEPEYVRQEFGKLFSDIKLLLKNDLSYKEVFYYASMVHLVFEKIHPFADGNGRAGRLLEKWFIARKAGENAWALKTEEYYAKHRADYYRNIHIGVNYYEIKMDRSLPFLLMLAEAATDDGPQGTHSSSIS